MTLPDRPPPAPELGAMPGGQAAVGLARVIDEISAPIAFWDRDMGNAYANRAYAAWFGTTPAQMRGVHLKDLIDERAFRRNLPSLQRALSGLTETYETRLRDVSGAVRDVQVTLTPLLADGAVSGFSVLFVDLTARVYAEAELRSHREAAAARRERKRIETQLHDVALQELYAAALALNVAIRAAPTEVEPTIVLALASIDHAIAEVRATVRVDTDTNTDTAPDGGAY